MIDVNVLYSTISVNVFDLTIDVNVLYSTIDVYVFDSTIDVNVAMASDDLSRLDFFGLLSERNLFHVVERICVFAGYSATCNLVILCFQLLNV